MALALLVERVHRVGMARASAPRFRTPWHWLHRSTVLSGGWSAGPLLWSREPSQTKGWAGFTCGRRI